ncbi:MAG: two-component system response regulator (stage 0 sporulation protein F) [Kiritimatiellia bacterium]|jgi:two-component system, response regulator, stage 0 sporulation protein F
MERKNFLTITEVSEYLKLPEETIYKYARAGRIPASKVGRYWRFDMYEIDRWVAEHSNSSGNRMSVLVVDDEPMIRDLMCQWLRNAGCDVDFAAGGYQVLDQVKASSYDLIFLDLMMPGMNGVEVLREIKAYSKDINVVIITSYFEGAMMQQALELGPTTIIKKPVIKETLLTLVKSFPVKGTKA